MDKQELLIDLIAREEWAVDYHKKQLQEATIKLNSLRQQLKESAALDVDALTRKRRYPDV